MKEIESNYWDDQSQRFLKIKLNTLFNSENKIICSKDGQILRMYQFSQQSDYLKDHVNNEEELNNLDQIKYLRWFGKQGEKNYKVGNWEAVWKDQILSDVGGYYSNNGQKQGIWTDLIKMYWSESQVYEVGEYENGIKVGRWKLLYDGQEIGGGSYNFQGNKDGKWFELSDNFWNKGQVMYYGEYFNGKKVGLWDILYKSKNDNNLLKFVGCGTYAQERKYDSIQINIKQGRWIEQSDQFWDEGQIIHSGVYKDGIKVGNWDTLYKSNKLNSNYELMGGGSYELKEGDNDFYDPIKSGSWIELSDGFRELNQIIYTGVYKNGKKTGYWDVLFKSIEANQFKKIGGGQYINKGQNDSVKDGDWIELSSKFNSFNQLTYNGKYRDGNKVDRWDAFFKQQGENYNFYFIGGGVYSSTIIDGATVKNGRWVEMSDSFWEQSEVTLEGKYQYGIKVGIWKSYFKDIITKKKEQIGGGEYVIEQDGNSQKSGMWIELSVGFRWSDQITFNGQYLKGQKFGKWDMYNKKGGYQKSQFEYMQVTYQCFNLMIVGEDHMILNRLIQYQVVQLRLECGLNQKISFGIKVKYFQQVSIQMVQKLVNGKFNIKMCQLKKLQLLVEDSIQLRNKIMGWKFQLNLEFGLNQPKNSPIMIKRYILGNTQMVKKQGNGIKWIQKEKILGKCKINS
ncbi:unnamed protein product [Paramecium octaurelia]|uniref:Uncharacterized protein n=1 Tax=Paramecium octaurelia TaxID=43137 RepID=A0A8S1VDA3_PAROT|nr:unnamed protein product [Paramecium octaurelia]